MTVSALMDVLVDYFEYMEKEESRRDGGVESSYF